MTVRRFRPCTIHAAAFTVAWIAAFSRPVIGNAAEATGDGPAPAAQVADQVKVPEGFHVSVFASEPDVQQPIGIATDERGRLWVAENYTYGDQTINFDATKRDRIVILADSDGDGQSDRRS